MEVLLVIGLIWGFFAFINYVGRQNAIKAAENNLSRFLEDNKFDFRIKRKTISGEDGFEFDILEFQTKGIIPISHETACSVYIHLYDDTDQKNLPVLSSIEWQQEEDSRVFQDKEELGVLPAMACPEDWVVVGKAIIECLIPPHSGKRKLTAQICIVDTRNPPIFEFGLRRGQAGKIFVLEERSITLDFSGLGYQEQSENRKLTEQLTIQLAFCLASSDGSIDTSEAKVIKDWVKKLIDTYSLTQQDSMKETFNAQLKTAFESASKGTLSLDSLLSQLRDKATTTELFEAIELCLDVMSADGHADNEELKMLQKIATGLNVDYEKFRALQDRRLSEIASMDSVGDNLKVLLGISDDMNNEAIRRHLNKEYKKWNSRVTSSDEKASEKAKEMLMLIAEARNKYL